MRICAFKKEKYSQIEEMDEKEELVQLIIKAQDGIQSLITKIGKAKQGFTEQIVENGLLMEYVDNLVIAVDDNTE